jgi:hypothetical protein
VSDIFGFFLIAEYGLITLDSCRRGMPPSECYMFWQSSGKTYLQKITNHCTWPAREVPDLSFFTFFENNAYQIKEEYIMPVITGAKLETRNVIYNMITSGHDVSYTMYCKMGSSAKLSLFSKADINNKESLFYENNLKSKLYKWFLLTNIDISFSETTIRSSF